MEWNNGESFEFKPGHETRSLPRLLADISEAGLIEYADEKQIPLHELMHLQKSILGTGLAGRLYREFQDKAKPIRDMSGYRSLDIKIVPEPDRLSEENVIVKETDEAYIISDAYSQYGIRLLAKQKPVGTKPNQYRRFINYIESVKLYDQFDEQASAVEFIINDDDTIDVVITEEGWQGDRRPSTVLQRVILARTLEDLLDLQSPQEF